MSFITRVALLTAVCAALPSTGWAQSRMISVAERTAAVAGVTREIEREYVFPELGRKMAAAVRERAARGEYDSVSDGPELASLLTAHLREVNNDLHVSVGFSADILPPQSEGPAIPTPEEMARHRSDLARDNYGFRRAEILPGNIGYIRFDLFAPPEFAAETYAAAMAFVADTDALIIDLRENGGSISPDAIPMLATYFFERPTHLIDLKWNFEETPRQLWTWAHVPGRRYLNKPVYVLTSRRTFSGAEEFAYDLKNLERATIVGDTTGGGANPGGTRRASDHFHIFVPFGRVTSPITGSNWEGAGVVPDIPVSSGKALLIAQQEAVRTLKATATYEPQKAALDQAEAGISEQLARFRRASFELKGHEGAREVFVAGPFNSWSPRATPMSRRQGRWMVEVELEPGAQPYKFIVDGRWMTDPANPETEGRGQFVNSVRMVQ